MTSLADDIRDLQAHAMADALGFGGIDYSGGAIRVTDDYRKTAVARAIPHAYFSGGSWWLPPDPDPESARFAIRLFPHLGGQYPELLAQAHLSAVDHTPIDLASAQYDPARQPWARVEANAAAVGITPHDFQRIDAQYALSRLDAGKGAYFGWEMGLGKTLGACMVIDGWPANFILVACPNDAKQDPWAQELARFCPWLNVVIIGNNAKARDAAMARARELMDAGEPTAVICHYAALPIIEGKNKRGWLPLGQFDLKIADEAHLFKTRTAKFVSTFRRIKAAGTLMLSGSVMSGRAEDLFVPYQIMRPAVYKSQWRDWNDRYLEVIDGDYGKIIVGPSMERLDTFKRDLGECLVVRPARDYLDLPEPRVIEHAATFHDEQRQAYHDLADELLAELPDGSIKTATDGAALLTALRRCTGGVPGPDGTYISGKADDTLKLCESAGDSQLVVFAWHKELVRGMAKRLREAGIPTGVVDGDVPRAERDRIVDLFKRQGFRVIVASIATLSVAVNLQNASEVVMAEESFDPIDNEQAIARVLRQGQTQHVVVHHLRVPDSVDDLDVLPAFTTKRELRRLVLGS